MEEDLKEIKKKYGEKMAHYCREQFPILLEKKGLLPTLIESNFNEYHHLFDDLEKNSAEVMFKNYIYNLVNVENNLEIMIDKTPQELMSMAGYTLKECTTEEEIGEYKKYYAENEELCTFKGNRLERCRVFFAVKKDVDLIKRENFPYPKREDAYGTSVISIQFEKDGTNTLSIKNRYNHRVNNPDATFSNNLDNIISGLTTSFERHLGIIQKYRNNGDFELPNYVKANDGRFYKYNSEMNNICYCPDNIIIDNFEVKRFDKSRYLVLDHFIIDFKDKKIILYDKNLEYKEDFQNIFKEIIKIEVINNNETKSIYITSSNNELLELTLDKDNKIIGLTTKNIKTIGNNFLRNSLFVEKINLSDTTSIGKHFMSENLYLRSLKAPLLMQVDSYFLQSNKSLEVLSLPSLVDVGDQFLLENQALSKLDLPNLEKAGDSFLMQNSSLKEVDLPNLIYIGKNPMRWNHILERFNTPKLIVPDNISDTFNR